MFSGCSALSEIVYYCDKLGEDANTGINHTRYWVQYVSSTGTWYNANQQNFTNMSDSEIPNGWVIKEGDAEEQVDPNTINDYFTISNLDSSQKTISLYVDVHKLYYSFDDNILKYILSDDLPVEKFEGVYRRTWTFNLQGNSKVRLKANSNSKYYGATFNFSNDTRKLTGINISGNIQTLSVGDDYKNLQNKATNCYQLFSDCANWTFDGLTLPATKLAPDCYRDMFNGCNVFTIIPKDLLPATELARGCYYGMFRGCTNILKSPVLPARQLVEDCYREMFQDCTKLREITFNGASIKSQYTYWWCDNVSPTGKIISLNKDLEVKDIGISGVPVGWEVIYKDSSGK